jgi:hypothetical protein
MTIRAVLCRLSDGVVVNFYNFATSAEGDAANGIQMPNGYRWILANTWGVNQNPSMGDVWDMKFSPSTFAPAVVVVDPGLPMNIVAAFAIVDTKATDLAIAQDAYNLAVANAKALVPTV